MADDFNYDVDIHSSEPIKAETSSAVQTVSEIKPLEADLDLDLDLDGKLDLDAKLALDAKINTDSHIAVEPLELGLRIDPLKTESVIDLKPAVVDLCLTLNVGKIPSVCIRQPYHHHVGFTLFGTEVWGYSFSGQQETVVEELDRRPQVAWGGAQIVPASHGGGHHRRPAPRPPPSRESGGLHIRLDG